MVRIYGQDSGLGFRFSFQGQDSGSGFRVRIQGPCISGQDRLG